MRRQNLKSMSNYHYQEYPISVLNVPNLYYYYRYNINFHNDSRQ